MTALVLHGNLAKLTPAQKVEYYRGFCERVGLDPATQPFKLLTLNGKEILYCDRGGTAQLNKVHKVSHAIASRIKEEEIYMVVARASTPDGRQTESIGAVSIAGLRGEALANAMMKAETKSKRRSTLDLLGLGMLDESEVDSIPGTQSESLSPEEEEKRKRWRVWRGKVNQRLLACKTLPEIEIMKKGFEDLLKVSAEFWQHQPTYHREDETFGSLVDEHRARIEKAQELDGPAGVEMWLTALDGCSSVKELTHYVGQFRSEIRFQNVKCEEALHCKALALGLTAYSDVEEHGDEFGLTDKDYTDKA